MATPLGSGQNISSWSAGTSSGTEVIKKYSYLKLRSRVFDWSETGTECELTNENPEI
jgi:hypothetical protein